MLLRAGIMIPILAIFTDYPATVTFALLTCNILTFLWFVILRPGKTKTKNSFICLREAIILCINGLYTALAYEKFESEFCGKLIIGAMIGVYLIEIIAGMIDTVSSLVEWIKQFKCENNREKCYPDLDISQQKIKQIEPKKYSTRSLRRMMTRQCTPEKLPNESRDMEITRKESIKNPIDRHCSTISVRDVIVRPSLQKVVEEPTYYENSREELIQAHSGRKLTIIDSQGQKFIKLFHLFISNMYLLITYHRIISVRYNTRNLHNHKQEYIMENAKVIKASIPPFFQRSPTLACFFNSFSTSNVIYTYHIPTGSAAKITVNGIYNAMAIDCITLGDYFYRIGGCYGSINVYCTKLTPPFTTYQKCNLVYPVSGSVSTSLFSAVIYTVGSFGSYGSPRGICQKYIATKDKWFVLKPLIVPCACIALCTFDERFIYAIGGLTYGRTFSKAIELFDAFDEDAGWKMLNNITGIDGADLKMGAWVVQISNGDILIMGGTESSHLKVHNKVHTLNLTEKEIKLMRKTELAKPGEFYLPSPVYKGRFYNMLVVNGDQGEMDIQSFGILKRDSKLIKFKDVWSECSNHTISLEKSFKPTKQLTTLFLSGWRSQRKNIKIRAKFLYWEPFSIPQRFFIG
eukprot:TRINITY_DN173_c3_g1_i8.p1 TRINITY_DN173_c3_g1~~TRINITY_DN173_c3_g1_i8.p1  ORF type:complete len:631 (-),score=3.02 TRINITY_DN173_c3_g1_i8:101-1993(-)